MNLYRSCSLKCESLICCEIETFSNKNVYTQVKADGHGNSQADQVGTHRDAIALSITRFLIDYKLQLEKKL